MNKLLFSTGLLLAAASSAYAQVTVGPRLGINMANVRQDFEEDDDETSTKAQAGLAGGVTLNAQFGNLAFQPSLLFSQKGFRVDEDKTMTFMGTTSREVLKASYRLNYFEVPLNLVYTTGGTNGFQVYGGPYVGFGLSGKAESEYSYSENGRNIISGKADNDVKFASEAEANSDKAFFRGLDAGVNGGLGFKASGFQAQLGYSLGLTNMLSNDPRGNEPDGSIKNGVLQFNLAYFLNTK